MNLDFVFKSSDHLRYENGVHVSGPHGGAGRAINIEPNNAGCEGYVIQPDDGFIVTLFNKRIISDFSSFILIENLVLCYPKRPFVSLNPLQTVQ